MDDAIVRRLVRERIVNGRLPRDRTGAVSATNGNDKDATRALCQSRLTKCWSGSPVRAHADSYFTPPVSPSGEMSGTR